MTLATLFPRVLAPLRASGEGLAAILMQVSTLSAVLLLGLGGRRIGTSPAAGVQGYPDDSCCSLSAC